SPYFSFSLLSSTPSLPAALLILIITMLPYCSSCLLLAPIFFLAQAVLNKGLLSLGSVPVWYLLPKSQVCWSRWEPILCLFHYSAEWGRQWVLLLVIASVSLSLSWAFG